MDVSAASAASLTVQSLSLRIAAKAISLGCACRVCTTQTNKDKFLPEIVKQNFGGQPVLKGLTGIIGVKVLPKGTNPVSPGSQWSGGQLSGATGSRPGAGWSYFHQTVTRTSPFPPGDLFCPSSGHSLSAQTRALCLNPLLE